jgi:hypothetical protein
MGRSERILNGSFSSISHHANPTGAAKRDVALISVIPILRRRLQWSEAKLRL